MITSSNKQEFFPFEQNGKKHNTFYNMNCVFVFVVFLLGIAPHLTGIFSWGRIVSYLTILLFSPIALIIMTIHLRLNRCPYQFFSFTALLYLIINFCALYRGFGSDIYPWTAKKQIPIVLLEPNTIGLLLPATALMYFNAMDMIARLSKVSSYLFFVYLLFFANIFFNPSIAAQDYSYTCTLFAPLRILAMNAFIPFFIPCLFKEKQIWISIVILFTIAFISFILARRGTFIFLVFVFLIANRYLPNTILKKHFVYLLLILGVIFLSIFTNDLGVLVEFRGLSTASRDGLIDSQLSQSSLGEIIFGKGVFGYYWGADFEFDETRLQYFDIVRFGTEIGFMDIILHTGIIGLLLHVIVFCGAIIKGLFFSASRTAKAMTGLIAIALFELIPYGIQSFSFFYVVVWLFISLIYSPSFRQLTDEEIISKVAKHEI